MRNRRSARRSGAATLWLIIWIPALLVMFTAMLNVANLWLARVELENALEAAALAAVKDWGDAGGAAAVGWTDGARDVGVDYAAANLVRGLPVMLVTNGMGPLPNENDLCDANKSPVEGSLVFGAITSVSPVEFDAGATPDCTMGIPYAVRAQAIMNVPILGGGFLPTPVDSYCVQAKATAMYDCTTGQPRLIRVDTFLCP